jgi:hypothetical protein
MVMFLFTISVRGFQGRLVCASVILLLFVALEETLSAIIMQAELLLISRNETAMAQFLPQFLRTSNLIESRRDTTCNMFLSGPSTNLLAPSFAGWKLDNGKYEHAYLAGLSISYIAALNRYVSHASLEVMCTYAYHMHHWRSCVCLCAATVL